MATNDKEAQEAMSKIPRFEHGEPSPQPAFSMYNAIMQLDLLVTSFPLVDMHEINKVKTREYMGIIDSILDTLLGAAYRDYRRIDIVLSALQKSFPENEYKDRCFYDKVWLSGSKQLEQLLEKIWKGVELFSQDYRRYVEFIDRTSLMDPAASSVRDLAKSRWHMWNGSMSMAIKQQVEHYMLPSVVDTGYTDGRILVPDFQRINPDEPYYQEISQDKRCRQLIAVFNVLLNPMRFSPRLGTDAVFCGGKRD